MLGLGEAASAIATDLVAAGVTVRAFDPAPRNKVPGTLLRAPADVARGAAVVLSVNSAAAAVDAARSVAGALEPGALFADLNTASPGRKREVSALVPLFADVALMRPVPGRGVRTPALASGPGGARFAELFGPLGMPVEIVDDAASRKLVRSVFMKGMAAAAGEALGAAEGLGCRDWLHDDLARTLAAADEALLDRLVDGSRVHAARRADEMAAAQAMLAELGAPGAITGATRAWLEELAG
jgi:3-hydroxyisobutyrate dehydrogenase-like beta-hydroxyacid dehydrogenase